MRRAAGGTRSQLDVREDSMSERDGKAHAAAPVPSTDADLAASRRRLLRPVTRAV